MSKIHFYNSFEKAAELGDIEAEIQLSQIYDEHQELDVNYEKVLYWTRSAANQNSTLALSNLATMYFIGNGVKQDKKKAHELNLMLQNLGMSTLCILLVSFILRVK